ncbi:MAG: hypothetical protein M1818_001024 [Claussenomyces sp. TS43310]|nr:MAG: hypothetical protein M1818_001024 [Claussenomyces sp. TS43310]
MTSPSGVESNDAHHAVPDADVAQAFKDLARGEQTALALESKMSKLEKKLDDLLASVEAGNMPKVERAASKGSGTIDGQT